MEPRQLFRDMTAQPTPTPLVGTNGRECSPVNLPEGIIALPNGEVVTLTAAAAFKPMCTLTSPPAIIANNGGPVDKESLPDELAAGDDALHYSDFRDPFYASTFPQCYALAATTIVAYTLVIMLLITPRSFLDGGVVVLGRKGFTNGGGGTSIGGRPWLQKVAALTVAISLTIATSATFREAEDQYRDGYQNAKYLQDKVLGGNELKIIRIISNTFLWLAQAQTLIRLFPRQREKVIIKWTAFSLITLDVIFQCLNSFRYEGQDATRPRSFTEAVPALSYLFALALGVLYAAWVIYYALMKKRYAFYHPQMKNICLVAVLSLLAILVPVVFFILDISKPEFTGWGDYVRWVGAAAASVIVWEWVERIEALEREEKKDGILGREVFDGDEMLEITPSELSWPRRRKKGPGDPDTESGTSGRDDGSTTVQGTRWPSVTSITSRYRAQSRSRKADKPTEPQDTRSTNHDRIDRIRFVQPPLWPARPPPAVTPVSRADTASAASTIYAVRYHPLTETTSRSTPPPTQDPGHFGRSDSAASSDHGDDDTLSVEPPDQPQIVSRGPRETQETGGTHQEQETQTPGNRWRLLGRGISLPRLGRSDRNSDSEKEQQVVVVRPPPVPLSPDGEKARPEEPSARWDIRTRLEEFVVTQAERLRERIKPTPDTDSLPVTVIPAPPRRGAALAQLRENEVLELYSGGDQGRDAATPVERHDHSGHGHRRNSSASARVGVVPGGDEAAGVAASPSPVSHPQLRRSSFGNTTGSRPPAPATPIRPRPSPIATTRVGSAFSLSSGRRSSNRVLPVTVIPAPPRGADPVVRPE